MSMANVAAGQPSRSVHIKLDGSSSLLNIVAHRKSVGPRSDVLRHDDIPKTAHLLLEGHTYRYRVLTDGRRQITGVMMPGDICDLAAVMRGRADYSVSTLTSCVFGEIPAEWIVNSAARDPEITDVLFRRLLRDEAISREWLVGMGRRTALERVAHLLCEFQFRLEAVGLAQAETFDLWFSQTELADVLGLSAVHINRVLQELRRVGLIQLSGGVLTILDSPTLRTVAGFDPFYLRM